MSNKQQFRDSATRRDLDLGLSAGEVYVLVWPDYKLKLVAGGYKEKEKRGREGVCYNHTSACLFCTHRVTTLDSLYGYIY